MNDWCLLLGDDVEHPFLRFWGDLCRSAERTIRRGPGTGLGPFLGRPPVREPSVLQLLSSAVGQTRRRRVTSGMHRVPPEADGQGGKGGGEPGLGTVIR